jgi:hypothetical protein
MKSKTETLSASRPVDRKLTMLPIAMNWITDSLQQLAFWQIPRRDILDPMRA